MKNIKGDASAAYRQLFMQASCPEEVRQELLQQCQGRPGSVKQRSGRRRYGHYAGIAVCCLTVLCFLGGILFWDQVSYALGKAYRRGYIYKEAEYEGLKFTETFVLFDKWDQEAAMAAQPPSGQYEGCYEDLKKLDMLKVLLPHYRVDAYKLEEKGFCQDGYAKNWYGIYTEGDSRIRIHICDASVTSAQSEVCLIDTHELWCINGIEYEIQYFSRQAGYEEYLLMQQYSRKEEAGEGVLSQAEYEEAFFYPVRIECLVNRVYYCFQLTEDIDLREFLESISYESPDARQEKQDVPASAEYEENRDFRPYRSAEDREAYIYTDVEYKGMQLVSCYMEVEAANQQMKIPDQIPDGQYAGVYEGLDGLNMLDVLLPHYRIEEYHLLDSGSIELQFDREWYGIYENGDSHISITIRDLNEIVATKSTDMLSGHESRRVNGVDYEILYHTRPITYEDYLLMQQYRVQYNYEAWSQSRAQYEESYIYYPVEIHCVVNGKMYTFEISGDVDPQEFLESIYSGGQ